MDASQSFQPHETQEGGDIRKKGRKEREKKKKEKGKRKKEKETKGKRNSHSVSKYLSPALTNPHFSIRKVLNSPPISPSLAAAYSSEGMNRKFSATAHSGFLLSSPFPPPPRSPETPEKEEYQEINPLPASTSGATGFSDKTCFPLRIAFSMIPGWARMGSTTITALMSSRERRASSDLLSFPPSSSLLLSLEIEETE